MSSLAYVFSFLLLVIITRAVIRSRQDPSPPHLFSTASYLVRVDLPAPFAPRLASVIIQSASFSFTTIEVPTTLLRRTVLLPPPTTPSIHSPRKEGSTGIISADSARRTRVVASRFHTFYAPRPRLTRPDWAHHTLSRPRIHSTISALLVPSACSHQPSRAWSTPSKYFHPGADSSYSCRARKRYHSRTAWNYFDWRNIGLVHRTHVTRRQ